MTASNSLRSECNSSVDDGGEPVPVGEVVAGAHGVDDLAAQHQL